MTISTQAKHIARTLADRSGFGHAYTYAWWRLHGRSKGLVTDWNRRHQAIFVHVPKAAGTSVAAMFGMPRPADFHAPVSGYLSADPALFARALKFTVVRNPWDRLVSAYHYGLTTSLESERRWADPNLGQFPDFNAFVRALRRPAFRAEVLGHLTFTPQHHFLCHPLGGLRVDRVCRFERLWEGMLDVGRAIGVQPHAIRINASAHRAYPSYYTRETRDIAAALYRRDIKLFGYRFGESEDAPGVEAAPGLLGGAIA
ncbi:MAG TPA: sulfotransferase family 2 domain-containing protein [Caulobacteraceae bacterium]